jgi:hypothetical protein
MPARLRCGVGEVKEMHRNPLPGELRCLYGVHGPGKFGLLSYLDVPVYQPNTPMPGTHVVGVAGMPGPRQGESFEAWEWRVLRTVYGREALQVHRETELLDPVVGAKIMRFEQSLAAEGIRFHRRETWRSPERQAFLFQQGRVRPGPLATSTLTSWHSRVDRLGRPAGRAVDYDVAQSRLPRFHELAAAAGLGSYGADSNDAGHVFYAGDELLSPTEIAVMRLLKRVPHVTLETGRPTNETWTYGSLPYFQEQARAFANTPLEPVPLLDPAAPLRLARIVAPPPAPPPPVATPPRGKRRGRH